MTFFEDTGGQTTQTDFVCFWCGLFKQNDSAKFLPNFI